jgi:protease I
LPRRHPCHRRRGADRTHRTAQGIAAGGCERRARIRDAIQGFNHFDKADRIPVDRPLENARPDDYDALLLPGGVINPDQLRLIPEAIGFIQHFVQADKPIAAICHGPWTLIDAEGVGHKRVTSWPSLKTDLRNAGAQWVDEVVVRDGSLVTSRKPDDIPAFSREMIELFAESKAEARAAE